MDKTEEMLSPGESAKVGSYVATPTLVDIPADETSSTGTGASKSSKSSKGKFKKGKKPGKARYPKRSDHRPVTIPIDDSPPVSKKQAHRHPRLL